MSDWTTFLRKLADESPSAQAFGLRETANELERLAGEVERYRSGLRSVGAVLTWRENWLAQAVDDLLDGRPVTMPQRGEGEGS